MSRGSGSSRLGRVLSGCVGLAVVELALVLFPALPRLRPEPKVVGSDGDCRQDDKPDQEPPAEAPFAAFLLVLAAEAGGFCGGDGFNGVLHWPRGPQAAGRPGQSCA